MLNKRRRQIKDVLIFLLLGIIFLTQLSRFYPTHHLLDIRHISPDDVYNETKLYFETDISFKMRLKLQEKIKFGGAIKRAGKNVFNTREGYNESFLDSLPILRDNIPDFLPKICKNDTTEHGSKTKVSVVINYHNELLSLLLRSIYTVIAAVPPQNFQELILIDDGSNLTSHEDLLEVEPLMSALGVPVRFHRFDTNKGLIYCRRFGCQHATGDAVLVLDSHIEVKPGFIEPLLKAVDENYKVIAAPVFDFWETFENKFWGYDGSALGFDHYLSWISVPKPKDGTIFKTPAILGGAFVAKKRFLEEIDYFGRCMEGWGYENIEIAMKTWMCGGEVIYVPCSRVLHFAAKRSPMMHGERKRAAHYLHNAGIVVKSFFPVEIYHDFNLANNVDKTLQSCQDTIQANKAMLRKNKCLRDFGWIRRNLMPSIESFDEETSVAHTLISAGKCLTKELDSQKIQRLFLEDCSQPKTIRNRIRLTKWGELRIYDRQCLDWGYENVQFSGCHNQGGNQATGYDTQTGAIFNKNGHNYCLGTYAQNPNFLERGPCHNEQIDPLRGMFSVSSFSFGTIFHKELLESS